MKKLSESNVIVPILCLLAAVCLSLASCGGKKEAAETSQHTSRLAGTWVLESRMTEAGEEVAANERFMKIVFDRDGTFAADYRGEEGQSWIRAGQGGFSFNPPYLDLYWDQGRITSLLVTDSEPDKVVFHHGRSMVPLKDQEPVETFVRHKIEKGPTRQPS